MVGTPTLGIGTLSPRKSGGAATAGSGVAAIGVGRIYTADSSGSTPLPATITGLPAGLYTFVVSGRGGRAQSPNNGGPGGLTIIARYVTPADVITVSTAGGGTQITFPDGHAVFAGDGGDGSSSNPAGTCGASGVATGGDVNLSAAAGGPVPSYNGLTGTGPPGTQGSTQQGGVSSIFIFKVA